MNKPVFDTQFWKDRIEEVRLKNHPLYWTVYVVGPQRWEAIEARHREVLAEHIKPTDRVLDAGCGYGRLLSLLPGSWHGKYLGVDQSPDFVQMARSMYPNHEFIRGDLRDLAEIFDGEFDWAVGVSLKRMIVNNCGDEPWLAIQAELRRCCRRVMMLEYDEFAEPEII